MNTNRGSESSHRDATDNAHRSNYVYSSLKSARKTGCLASKKDRTLTAGRIKRRMHQATHDIDKIHRIADAARAATPMPGLNLFFGE